MHSTVDYAVSSYNNASHSGDKTLKITHENPKFTQLRKKVKEKNTFTKKIVAD